MPHCRLGHGLLPSAPGGFPLRSPTVRRLGLCVHFEAQYMAHRLASPSSTVRLPYTALVHFCRADRLSAGGFVSQPTHRVTSTAFSFHLPPSQAFLAPVES